MAVYFKDLIIIIIIIIIIINICVDGIYVLICNTVKHIAMSKV